MKTPFVIKFTKRFNDNSCEISNNEILKKFKFKFDTECCDNSIIINDSKLIVDNEILRNKFVSNLNIWNGIGHAELETLREQKNEITIVYIIHYTKLVFFILLGAIGFALFESMSAKSSILSYALILLVFLLSYVAVRFRHWCVFSKIVKRITKQSNVSSSSKVKNTTIT